MKAFVLLSGGIDSAVCLQEALKNHDDVEAIHVNYGQQTELLEHRNSKLQADYNNIPFHLIDYRNVFKHFAEGTIEDKDYDSGKTEEQGHSVGYVPQRNAHLITTATALAEHYTEAGKPIKIYHGAQQGDAEDYPDCRPDFMDKLEKMLNNGTDQHDIQIENPIIDMVKEKVIQYGEELGVDWKLTFSCYNDENGNPCMECPACLERLEGFRKAEVNDPL